MRVVIAPDCFGGTLTATEAAEAIAEGWRRASPDDELALRPLADGGPGFVSVIHTAMGGVLHRATVTGPLGSPVAATWLMRGGVAYIESAEAAGLHLVPAERRPQVCEHVTTRGVGELIAAARDKGAHEIIVGLGGSATTDGGSGALTALGVTGIDGMGSPLLPGALGDCVRVDGVADIGRAVLIAASDVENPLLGPHGAAATFGPQKGADPAGVERLDRALTTWADSIAAWAGRDVRDTPGAGAAGGLGFALLALGAEMKSGADIVSGATNLSASIGWADLVITGEGSFDWQSLRGKLVTRVAGVAAARGVPCLALAGQVAVGRRQAAAAGVEAAYSVVDHVGSVEASMADPAGTLADLAEHVAGQWAKG
ncbi:Glycerate kinase [Alloactinosynnema sp. L-07]|uniref:glycerate kinase family protein n=1 Tax=Alloactinosynnema sp. L-07 TaxID=1653480 RepID=UPI00065EF8EE|nr:glycerate kinase [Alloactinosynnema sp. L-07]CRK55673.1 Glycerate kinase [Alloactinosynnema sp. L-07]